MKPGQIIKTFTTRKNRQAVIRVIKLSDLEPLLAFRNALVNEDTFIAQTKTMTLAQEKKYITKVLNKIKNNQKIHLIVEVDGSLAGSCEVRIGDKREVHSGEIGISLAAPYRQEGIGYVCMQTLIEEAQKLGLKLLWLHCFENNTGACHLYEKVGFTKSGIVPEKLMYKGEYVGEVTMYRSL